MNEQQRPWRLPEGVKFYVYPRYLLIVEGVEVKLTPMQAKIVLFLMANPGRRWSSQEIASAIYSDHEDGGARDYNCIAVHMVNILKICHRAGVNLCMKTPGLKSGYTFVSISLTERGKADAIRLASLPASDPRSPSRPRKFVDVKAPRAPKGKKGRIEHHPYINVYDGTGGWTFPIRIEQDQWRRMKVSVK